MLVNFTKMHGAGNDFVVIDAIAHDLSWLSTDDWQYLADRHFGIGADQILLAERPTIDDVDFKYTIYNQDGGMVENCGNGARCFVKYVHDHGLTHKNEIKVQIVSGVITLTLNDNGLVTVNMGAPIRSPIDVPVLVDDLPTKVQANDTAYGLMVDGEVSWLSFVSMGNPHAVCVVDDVDTTPVLSQGAFLEIHKIFPHRANISFMQVVDSSHIRLRVFERGVGETLACGTGACAAVVTGISRGLLISPVTVSVRGGELLVSWSGGQSDVLMSGSAVTVFEGQINLEQKV